VKRDELKYRNLILGIVFDAIGSGSLLIPFLGDLTDVVWAPVSAGLMIWMYKGKPGKLGGVFSFLEEILPLSDIIPSFTLMWLYTYVLNPSAALEQKSKTDSIEDPAGKGPEKS
jgi:hypothetical protein